MCISQSSLPKYFDLLGSLFKNLQNPYVKIENKGKRINLSGPCCLVQSFLKNSSKGIRYILWQFRKIQFLPQSASLTVSWGVWCFTSCWSPVKGQQLFLIICLDLFVFVKRLKLLRTPERKCSGNINLDSKLWFSAKFRHPLTNLVWRFPERRV